MHTRQAKGLVVTARHALVAVISLHALLMFTGYFGLVSVFDFPDILRTEPANILARFRRDRALVQGFYAAFMYSQIAFVGVVLALRERVGGTQVPLLRAATHLGVLAGFAQAIGFARWPFVVPSLADGHAQSPEATLLVLDTVHRLAGVAVGEHLFFCFEALWAVVTGLHLMRTPAPLHVSRASAWLLVVIGTAIALYTLEQFGGPFVVLGPVNVFAHGGLLFWLIGLAITEVFQRHLRRWEAIALVALWAAAVLG